MLTTAQIFTSVLIVCFFGIMVGIGFYSRRHATSVDGFVLGGRSVGPWLTAFAYGTSYFSAVIFVGYAGQFGWNFGVASTWIGLGNAFIGSLLAWNILGRRTRLMTQHINSKTMPDFFEKRYNSKALKIAASVIVFVFLIPYTASLYNGLSSLFNIAFEIDYWICIVVMAVLTGLYVLFGGYMATAINDFIQGIIMLVGIAAVVIAVLNQNGGFMGSFEALATSPNGGWEYTAMFGPDPIALLVVVLLTSLGTWGLPQMVGKFYAISNEAAIKKGTLISTVFAVVVAGGCYFLGGFGRLFVTPEAVKAGGFDSIIPSMLSNLSPYIIGIVILLVLSASMSTLSSLVLTSASTLALDVWVPSLKKAVSEKKKLVLMRLLIVFFIVLSAVIAILKDSIWKDFVFIAQMMGISWGALAGSFLAPFLFGLYWKKTTRPAVWASFVFGVGVMVFQLLISMKVLPIDGNATFIFKNSLYSGVFAMLGGFVIVPVVSLLTQKHKPENTDELFACYDTATVVSAKSSLNEK